MEGFKTDGLGVEPWILMSLWGGGGGECEREWGVSTSRSIRYYRMGTTEFHLSKFEILVVWGFGFWGLELGVLDGLGFKRSGVKWFGGLGIW